MNVTQRRRRSLIMNILRPFLSFLSKHFQNLLLLMLLTSHSGGQKQKNITFQLQASMTGEFDLSGFIPGIDVALDIINENSTILPDYHLQYKDIVDAKVMGIFWELHIII